MCIELVEVEWSGVNNYKYEINVKAVVKCEIISREEEVCKNNTTSKESF